MKFKYPGCTVSKLRAVLNVLARIFRSRSNTGRPLFEILQQLAASLGELPPLLPLGHITDQKAFEQIGKTLQLQPMPCPTFRQNLIYLFYGGLFHRGPSCPTPQAGQYPVGLLFGPEILDSVERIYPFDTGAMAAGKYGNWQSRMRPFRERLLAGKRGDSSAPQRLVRLFFGTNANYQVGAVTVLPGVTLSDPADILADFLTEDMTKDGIDQRQYRIECSWASVVPLKGVLWASYPHESTLDYAMMFETLNLPDNARCPYHSYRSLVPAQMAAAMQEAALTSAEGLF
jgi:hypothetical protein